MAVIAIDVDNTLLHEVDGKVVVRHDLVALMRAVHALGLADILVWSGGGADYAIHVVRKLGLADLVSGYASKGDPLSMLKPDITIDDQVIRAGTVNLKLPGNIEATPWMGVSIG